MPGRSTFTFDRFAGNLASSSDTERPGEVPLPGLIAVSVSLPVSGVATGA